MITNTCSSLSSLKQRITPAGKRKTRNWRSMKNDGQAVGWCSDTDAMIGIYLGGGETRLAIGNDNLRQ